MKKLLVSTFLSLFAFTTASAEVGVNVGVSGQLGLFAASVTETEGTGETHDGADHLAIGFGSIFVEKDLGDKITIGIDYVPESLDTETAESTKYDKTTTDTQANVENKVQASFEDHTTIYVNFNINESFYVKAGMISVDVITNESLGTGSTYGNTSLDGTMLGFGYNNSFDNGAFVRVETNYMDFDGASVTSSANSNKVTINQLDGVTAKFSIGKSF